MSVESTFSKPGAPAEDGFQRAERLANELCEAVKTLPPAEQGLVLRCLSDKLDQAVDLTPGRRRLNRLALDFALVTMATGVAIYLAERFQGSSGFTGATVGFVGLFLFLGALSPYLTGWLRRA